MSIVLARKEIERFIGSDLPEVLCIRGRWGVGKTYAWRQILLEAQKRGGVALKTYSYVSLFGLNSLDQLKYSIFENTVSCEALDVQPSIETLKANTISVANSLGRKSLRYLGHIPYIDSAIAGLQSASFLSVRERIICIDDLERSGDDLRPRDILGLLAQLKENRGCKAVLILNEDALDNEKREEFRTHGEKVLDLTIEFQPTTEESVDLALQPHPPIYENLREKCIALEICNIRVIRRAERLASLIYPLIADLHQEVLNQAIQTLTLLCWSVFSGDEAAPTLDFILKKRGRALYGMTASDLTDEERRWDALLDQYGFMKMDAFDLTLSDGLQAGFFDEAAVKKQAELIQQTLLASELMESFRAAWRLFNDSFAENSTELVDTLYSTAINAFKIISPFDLNSAVFLLKGLGHRDKARALIDTYLTRDEERDFFDLSKQPFETDIDEDIAAAFKGKLDSFSDERSPKGALLKISINQSWGPSDLKLLGRLSSDDFYKLFHSLQTEDLRLIVQGALMFSKLHGASDEMKAISSKATEALQRIGRENPLNRQRVQRFGIRVED